MIVRAALIALSSALLAACASQPVTDHAKLPGSAPLPASTMFVPARQTPLATSIRASLAARGWRLVPYTAGVGDTQADARAMSKQALYRLTLGGRTAGRCRDDGPGYAYQISIIENRSGKVPLAMSGADCLDAIVPEFQRQMIDARLRPTSQR